MAVIVVTGIQAAGKSTVAQVVAGWHVRCRAEHPALLMPSTVGHERAAQDVER